MDMSNKTSDENVANIEDDVKYVKEMLEIARIFFKAVKAETDYKNVDEIAFCNAIENILAERELKDKRIQELEGENVIQRRQLNSAFDNGYILHTYKIRKLIANETIDISGFKCIAVEDLEELLEDK